MANKSQIKIIKVGHKIEGNKLFLALPKGAAGYLNLTDNKVALFAVPVEGVIQLTTQAPTAVIPVARITEDDFVTQ